LDGVLKQSAERAAGAEDLRAAFHAFERASLNLSQHYDGLAAEVARLNQALERSQAARRAELEARERVAARLHSLLEALPGGVVVLDHDGRVQQFNRIADELLTGMAIGAPWVSIVARNVAPRWDDGHDISLRSGRRVNISTQALAHEPGQILLLTDVSETRRLQDQLNLHRRLSANTETAATLAHQLRTPLSGALLIAAQLAHGKDPGVAKSGQRIRDALRRLERLIDDILLFTRGGALGAETVPASRLREELKRSIAEMRLPESMRFDLPAAWPAVDLHVNLNAMLSIMLNLVHNAVQACGGRGRLSVDSALDGPLLLVAFTDDGPGVAPERRERIFEPFFTTRAGGTGMGLAVARSVARAHGGELSLDSHHIGGARFELRLPIRSEEQT
jgi:two-component system sensor histidine kinase FlrB